MSGQDKCRVSRDRVRKKYSCATLGTIPMIRSAAYEKDYQEKKKRAQSCSLQAFSHILNAVTEKVPIPRTMWEN